MCKVCQDRKMQSLKQVVAFLRFGYLTPSGAGWVTCALNGGG